MTALCVLARVVVAGVDLALSHVRHVWRRATARPRWPRDVAEAKAAAVGYRGPIDPAGQWIEDLAAGRIDHDGRPRAPLAT